MSDKSAHRDGTAELLKHIDIEEILQETDLYELFQQMQLETVLGSLGSAAGREIGAVLGRKLDASFGSTGSESDEPAGDETVRNGTASGEGSTDDGPGGEKPDTREELEELSYRELQSLTQDTDVKGNISQERMIEQLADEFGIENE
jgi:hypothetical protein